MSMRSISFLRLNYLDSMVPSKVNKESVAETCVMREEGYLKKKNSQFRTSSEPLLTVDAEVVKHELRGRNDLFPH